ncbi:hypothetical protein BASA83_008246 [Batrachochytrium salamandrivorans]|nr:hypothetical protein BASA83_008246 [Batrachochytrium salamandrivorans]
MISSKNALLSILVALVSQSALALPQTSVAAPNKLTGSSGDLAKTTSLLAKLSQGTFQGKLTEDSQTVSFLGVPYAAPPVGPLRFKFPKPPLKTPHGKVFDATKYGNACMQVDDPAKNSVPPGTVVTPPPPVLPNFNRSEDCLNLNVYVPVGTLPGNTKGNRQQGPKGGLPVMVYIHGGSFLTGYNADPLFNGEYFLKSVVKDRKVIIVVPNYRLGVFGFIASSQVQEDGGLNAGLADQRAAFEWVHKNIARFGGDPNRVTAWGESAGAMSVTALLLDTPALSKASPPPPYHRAIIESGALMQMITTPSISQPAFDNIVNATGCNATTGASVSPLDCLRALDATKLIVEATKLKIPFAPCVDGLFFQTQPSLSLAPKTINKAPIMLISNTNEGTGLLDPSYATSLESAAQFQNGTFYFLNSTSMERLQTLYPLTDPASTNSSTLKLLYEIADPFGDLWFQCPMFDLAEYASSPSTSKTSSTNPELVYKARFDISPTVYLTPELKTQFGDKGAFHTAELPFVWGHSPLLNTTNGEVEVSHKMVNTLADFAYGCGSETGNSRGKSDECFRTLGGAAAWPTYTSNNSKCVGGVKGETCSNKTTGQQLVWQLGGSHVESLPTSVKEKCDFWRSEIAQTIARGGIVSPVL